MGVFYDIRVHLAENADDYTGKKGSTVCMGIRKVCRNLLKIVLLNAFTFQVQFAPSDVKQRSPTSTAEKGFMFGSGRDKIVKKFLYVVFKENWCLRQVLIERFTIMEKIFQFMFQ